VGWRWLFAASIVPVVVLSLWRWRTLAGEDRTVGAGLSRDLDQASGHKAPPTGEERSAGRPILQESRAGTLLQAVRGSARMFLLCFGLASLTIASGTMNVFYAKELPQSPVYTVLFWANVAPGMLLGAWVVRRWGLAWALGLYATVLMALSAGAWLSGSARAGLVFALVLPLLNGIPFGLMGAWFNEVFGSYRTMLSGAAYNLGRILAGFAPVLIVAFGLHENGRYFLFSAFLGLGVLGLAGLIAAGSRGRAH